MDNFAIYQLYCPYLFFKNLIKREKILAKGLNCCYLTRTRHKDTNFSIITLYLYNFKDTLNMSSINLLKKKQYHLQNA